MDIISSVFVQVADGFLPAAEALLRRGSRMMGGLRVKQLVRALSLCIGLFVKHLTIKIEDLSVASGFTPLTSSTKSVTEEDLIWNAQKVDIKCQYLISLVGRGGRGRLYHRWRPLQRSKQPCCRRTPRTAVGVQRDRQPPSDRLCLASHANCRTIYWQLSPLRKVSTQSFLIHIASY